MHPDGTTFQAAASGSGRATPAVAGSLGGDTMVYNERSLYRVPGTRKLVNLLRGGGAHALYASTCEIPAVPTVATPTFSSCRPGVGDAFMNLPMELVVGDNANTVLHLLQCIDGSSSLPPPSISHDDHGGGGRDQWF